MAIHEKFLDNHRERDSKILTKMFQCDFCEWKGSN